MVELSGNSTETERLLREAQTGQDGAVGRLLAQHRGYLRQLVGLRLDQQVRARIDPSDVVQEIQMEAIRRVDGYLKQPPLPFRLWLRQIAFDRLVTVRRQHLSAARRAVRREVALPERSSLILAQQLLARDSSPSERLSRRELARRVREALDRLADADRELLLMRNFEGLSNQEAAHVLQITPATASQRYGRALLRLRDLLLDTGFSEAQS